MGNRGHILETTVLRTWKQWFFALFVVGLLVFPAHSANPPDSFADIVQPLLPAVVNISTTSEAKGQRGAGLPDIPEDHPFYEFFRRFMEDPQFNRPRKTRALGSGFIINPEGHIVTNYHLIADADEITVILHDKRELKAKLIGSDPRTDLAILKVTSKEKLPHVKWGDSDQSRVGDWVIAIGNPFGLGSTVTAGIISTTGRDISLRTRRQSAASYVEGYIQTDASINVGNSGGPMFNVKGEVIGINTAILSPSGGNVGIGFAIPANLAKPVIAQLKQYGRTRRGWLGVQIQKVDKKIAESFGLKKPEGALVGSVNKDGPAAKSGLKTGDIILSFNNVQVKESRSLPRIVGESPINKQVPVVVWRGGNKMTLKVNVGEFEKAEEKGWIPSATKKALDKGEKVLGLRLKNLTSGERAQFNLDKNIQGVLVIGVEGYSEASEKGLQKGDVLLAVNNQGVKQVGDVINAVELARQAKKKDHVLILMQRGDHSLFLTLSLDDKLKSGKDKPAKPKKPKQKR